jgi:sortase (surface protein transpeptidase)
MTTSFGDRRTGERRSSHETPPAPARPRLGRRTLAAGAATVALTLVGVGCLGYVATNQTHFPQPALSTLDTTIPAALTSGTKGPIMTASTPTAIDIPAIKVRSTMTQLGLTASNEVEVPAAGPDYDKTGWYKYSAVPGTLGPAVVVGHVDSARSGPSVFFELGALKAKDTVRITRADGSIAVYAVDDVLRFKKSEFPTALVYGDTDHAALRLVTCGGPFEQSTGHYRDNIIVTASLVSAE